MSLDRRSSLAAVVLFALVGGAALVGCSDDGGDDAGAATESSAAPGAEGEGAPGASVDDEASEEQGDGWRATFPGPVERGSDPVDIPGGEVQATAESATWESSDEAISVLTTDFPPDIIAAVEANDLLAGTASGYGDLVDGSPLLDPDGTFDGRPAVAFEQRREGLVTFGIALVDGSRLVQLLHVSRDGDTGRFEAFVESFELTGG
jgi:hypothetical protein